MEFNDLAAFVSVARAGGFRDAARISNVSASSLSIAVRRLEAKLGMRLLNRTTRSVAPTEAGLRLLEKLAPLFSEMEEALEVIAKLKVRAAKAGITGNREYNGGWHTALDLDNLLTVSEIVARAALERKESRGAQFRDDYPEKSEEWAKFNLRVTKAADGEPEVSRVPVVPVPAELKQVIEEQK